LARRQTQLDEQHALSLEIPCDPGYLVTARLFAAAAARRFGIDEETIEDIKLAVSESCTGAIGGQNVEDAGTLLLEIWPSGDRIVFRLRSVGPIVLEPPVGEGLLRALFGDVRVESTPSGGNSVTFSAAHLPG